MEEKNNANYSFRTDLANETHELLTKEIGHEPDGMLFESFEKNGVGIDTLTILNEEGEKRSGKPCGKYVTVNIGKIWLSDGETFQKVCAVVADEIRPFIPKEGSCLYAGLGNRGIIADAMGPETASNFIVTRHIKENKPELFNAFQLRETSCIIPGVLGNTGVEAAEIIQGVVENTKPSFIVVIDSLSSRRLSRLATTIQICDTGISPGSGIENSRRAINKETMGIPVIAIGVPTVVDAVTLALDLLEEAAKDNPNTLPTTDILSTILHPQNASYFVAPKETDHIIKDTAKLLGYAINAALHENLGYDEMDDFLS